MSITFPGLPLTTTPGAASGPALRRAAAVATLLMAAAVPTAALGQLTAGEHYDWLREPLSTLSHAAQGWWFPLALALLATGLLLAALLLREPVRRSGSRGLPALALAVAGGGAATAACFPADAVGATWVGEVHRWGSLLVLLGPLLAGAALARTGDRTQPADPVLRIALVVAAGAGSLFLAGFLPGLVGAGPSALTAVQGLTQRVLAVAVVLVGCRCAVLAAARAPRTAA